MMTMFRTSLERGTFGPATMLLKKTSKPFPQVLITLKLYNIVCDSDLTVHVMLLIHAVRRLHPGGKNELLRLG